MKKFTFALAMACVAMPAAVQAQDGYEYAEEADEWVAPAENKAGFRVEGRLFYEQLSDPDLSRDIVYEVGEGIGAGVEFGADFAVGETLVVGPYATFDFSSTETCDFELCLGAPGYWAVGLHAGFATGSNGMVYGKIGYGQQEVTLEGSFTDPDLGLITLDESETGGGYNFALGYEHGFGGSLYGRAELGVSESYDIYSFDIQRGYLGIALGARF